MSESVLDAHLSNDLVVLNARKLCFRGFTTRVYGMNMGLISSNTWILYK